MAEFTEIWESWKQMCQYQRDLEEGSCAYSFCPLRELGCNSEYPKNQIHYDGKAVEEIITEWAETHPDPVYPTWYRWLTMMGAIPSSDDLWTDLQQPIPADIAEKLGVEPKEG